MSSNEYLFIEIRLPKIFVGYDHGTLFHFCRKYRCHINLGKNNSYNIDLHNLGENLLLINMAYIYRLEMDQYVSPRVGCLISLKKNQYIRKDLTIDKINHLTYRSFIKAKDKFEKLGFINTIKGYRNLKRTQHGNTKSKLIYNKGCRSIMYLTDLGRGFIRQYIISNQTEIKIEEITVRNIIAVNNGGYRRICNNYQLNKKLKLINSNIDTYTYAYADNIDDLGALYVNKSNKIYFGAYGEPCANYVNNYNILYNRVFGDINFKKGGRFFNEISSMPKKRRSNLLIDGKHTVELDFSCLHPRILYHQLGIDEVRDIYTLGIDINGPDFENIRKAHKVAFNILINCSKKDPVKALNNFYYKQSIRKFRDETRTPMKLPEEWSAKQIIDSVKNNHPKLAKYFNKGIGIKLQNLESKIAEKVMLHFATLKRPCLSVHDSFIVWEKDKEELRKIMLEAYKEVVNTEFEAAVM